MTLKIVSGGQTGVDRAALDAARGAGTPCGGWCPRGRRAEDGPIPPGYPLAETATADYRERTHANVALADATLVVAFGEPHGGTALTIAYCRDLGRPWLVLDAARTPVADAASRAAAFVRTHDVAVLNVAGPRASSEPRAYGYAHVLVSALLASS